MIASLWWNLRRFWKRVSVLFWKIKCILTQIKVFLLRLPLPQVKFLRRFQRPPEIPYRQPPPRHMSKQRPEGADIARWYQVGNSHQMISADSLDNWAIINTSGGMRSSIPPSLVMDDGPDAVPPPKERKITANKSPYAMDVMVLSIGDRDVLLPIPPPVPETIPPKFNVGDIVYMTPHPNIPVSGYYPAIGSPLEIDCKVLSSDRDMRYQIYVYRVITGNGTMLHSMPEILLVAARDKMTYIPNCKVAKEDTELFPAGTPFRLEGEYMVNDLLGVYIHTSRFEKLKHLFV